MTILNAKLDQIGESGVAPKIIRLKTDDTVAEVTATGYLNGLKSQGMPLSEEMMALVETKASPSAASKVAWMELSKSGDDWSLVPSETTLPLDDGKIFVGNSSNVATEVDMSGDVAISNAGATTIQANAVESSMIANNAVTSGKIADDSVTSAKIKPIVFQWKQIAVNLSSFIGCYGSPVELVPAAGAGTKLILHRATLWIDYGGTVLADGGAMHIQYDSTANGAGTKATNTIAAASLIAATADTHFGFSPVDSTLTDSTTLDKGLYLSMATQDFTGGTNSEYTLDVWYSQWAVEV